MAASRWLADEMLGRLSRYLRFLGHDTQYVRGQTDREIVEQIRRDGRRLLTRDRALAARVPSALLLASPYLPDQLRQLHAEAPDAGYLVTFDRCSVCNGRLEPWVPQEGATWPAEVPRAFQGGGAPVFECPVCHHRYWEGSHTARIREQIAMWLAA